MNWRYCDECQRPKKECDADKVTQCIGRLEREYEREQYEWETSPDWIEGGRVY